MHHSTYPIYTPHRASSVICVSFAPHKVAQAPTATPLNRHRQACSPHVLQKKHLYLKFKSSHLNTAVLLIQTQTRFQKYRKTSYACVTTIRPNCLFSFLQKNLHFLLFLVNTFLQIVVSFWPPGD